MPDIHHSGLPAKTGKLNEQIIESTGKNNGPRMEERSGVDIHG